MSSQRISFHFPQEAAKEIFSIQSRSRFQSPSNIIRAAIDSYKELIDIYNSGCLIIIRSHDGKELSYSPYEPFKRNTHAIVNDGDKAYSKRLPKNYFFSSETAYSIDKIKELIRVRTNADVIRFALSSYDELVKISAAGDRIIIRDENSREQLYTPHSKFVPTTVSIVNYNKECRSNSRSPVRRKDSSMSRRAVQKTASL